MHESMNRSANISRKPKLKNSKFRSTIQDDFGDFSQEMMDEDDDDLEIESRARN
jgi:hypothetical protein